MAILAGAALSIIGPTETFLFISIFYAAFWALPSQLLRRIGAEFKLADAAAAKVTAAEIRGTWLGARCVSKFA